MYIYIGLYRDDGLSALKLTDPEADDARKDMHKIFGECGIKVTVDPQLICTDFLDVNLHIQKGTYWPYRKPNNELLYINAKSNHPPSILKQIPKSIENRIQSLSYNREEFVKAMPEYHAALAKSGFQPTTLPADPVTTPTAQVKRRRNITWFNPPYSQNVSTDVARQFLKLIDRHFPKSHKYHKLFNRNTVKVSYSCMPNMGAIIASHNAKILAGPEDVPRTCNCRKPETCPLEGECLKSSIVYKATVSAAGKPDMTYFGLTEGPFKLRYSNHKQSFKPSNEDRRHETRLSTYMWELKEANTPGNIKWEVARKSTPYKCGSRYCDLCTSEKLAILLADSSNLLNKRSEIISTCRHRTKFKCGKAIKKQSNSSPDQESDNNT